MKSDGDAELLSEYGNHLRNIIKEKKVSLRKLSKLTGVDFSDLAKIERGETNTTITTILRISTGLKKTNPTELFTYNRKSPKN
jgi:Predicted transcriptional regulator with C-terminal CBS domains